MIVGLYVLSESSLSLLMVSTVLFAYGSLIQAIAVFVILGKYGIIFFGAVQLLSLVISTVFGFLTMVPSTIVAPLGLLIPMFPYTNLLQSLMLFQTRGGMNWQNLGTII